MHSLYRFGIQMRFLLVLCTVLAPVLLFPGLCKRCVMMLQCKPIVGADEVEYFLGIDMSMG